MVEDKSPAELARLVKSAPMRRMATLVCKKCKHEWVQPSVTGRCPRCRTDATSLVNERVSVLRTL